MIQPVRAGATLPLLLAALLGSSGCDSLEPHDQSGPGIQNPFKGLFAGLGNSAPIADAGGDQAVNEGTAVLLNATSSHDPDGSIVSYQWQQHRGPEVALSGTSEITARFQAPEVTTPTELLFSVTVTDNSGATASSGATLTILPVNLPPIAAAGGDQQVAEQSEVSLTAAASRDEDGTISRYQWRQLAGDAVVLQGADSAIASFQAPALTAPTTLQFELEVSDNEGSSSRDEVAITIEPINAIPVAVAGGDQQVVSGSAVMLNAAGSHDSDGDLVRYQWQQSDGPAVTLTGNESATPHFTAPKPRSDTTLQFTLTVYDNEGGSSSDIVAVVVQREPGYLDLVTGMLRSLMFWQ